MSYFTKQERSVLIALSIIFLFGSILDYSLKKYPQLKSIVNFVDSEEIYRKIDVNKASKKQLISIPYIGEYTALKIIEYRNLHGGFTSLDELKKIRGIKNKNFERFKIHLAILP